MYQTVKNRYTTQSTKNTLSSLNDEPYGPAKCNEIIDLATLKFKLK